ncbi:hypothetical protein AN2V17_34010 [Vallitalea sp. AN17-2]|uniref:Uncharacterized protein n=1 Tax=Vallitalea maricola TaxID=3074433 RepID=A0ACB5UNN9_9FIRM|nr:hypothetical protein AN2V17_34010 [Vallitalea sp. AN17-2]
MIGDILLIPIKRKFRKQIELTNEFNNDYHKLIKNLYRKR